MDHLPDDILQQIFLFISPFSEVVRISGTCKHWRRLVVYDEWFLQQYFSFLRRSLTHSNSQILGWLNCDSDNFVNPMSYQLYQDRTLQSLFRNENRLPMKSLYLDPDILLFEFKRLGVRTLAFWIRVDAIEATRFYDLHESPTGCPTDRAYGTSTPVLSLIRWHMTNDLCLCLNNAHLVYMNFACLPFGIDKKVSFLISQHEWHHIVLLMAADRTTLSLYIDGKRRFYLNNGGPSRDEDAAMLSNGRHSPWLGRIADAAMWSRVLHPYEIKAIYTQRNRLDRVNVLDYLQSNFRHMSVRRRSSGLFDNLRRFFGHL